MKKIWHLAFYTAIILFASCKYPTEYKPVNAGKFSMMVPPWTKEDKQLKPGAEFQYANRFRNFYVIGEDLEHREIPNDLGEIMHYNLDNLRKAMKQALVSDSAEVTIGGLKAVRAEIFGKMDGETIYYSEVVIKGKKSFYHLSLWTRGEDRKLKFKDDINHILYSFKENP